jgi:hypothetical protein
VIKIAIELFKRMLSPRPFDDVHLSAVRCIRCAVMSKAASRHTRNASSSQVLAQVRREKCAHAAIDAFMTARPSLSSMAASEAGPRRPSSRR